MILANPIVLRNIAQKIAFIDAIIMQDWDYRYYSYNSHWSDNEEMGSMRDGSGNCYFILFEDECKKCFIKVIDKQYLHNQIVESEINKLDSSEKNGLVSFLSEPAFLVNEISYLYWNMNNCWKSIEHEKNTWLSILKNPIHEYQIFAKNYYEKELSIQNLEKFINGEITKELIKKINPNIDFEKLGDDINEIGIKVY